MLLVVPEVLVLGKRGVAEVEVVEVVNDGEEVVAWKVALREKVEDSSERLTPVRKFCGKTKKDK